ncbi:MAG TPA: NUDIX domain-containing protein [Candidatus Saccharimonadales bacterium]|nr:NUDIX domain-containing protein [Candidatus Saccharimonadales bacterium]
MNEDIFQLGIKGLIRNSAGQVLLLQVNPAALKGNKHGVYWDLPGGRIHTGDTVLDTLQREILEETGIATIENPKHIGMVLSNVRIPIPVGEHESTGLILSVYECDAPQDAEIKISEEHQAYQWFSPQAAAEKLQVKYPADFCGLIAQL